MAEAQFAYGVWIYNGSAGLRRDRDLGMEWMMAAADQGYEPAVEEVRKLRRVPYNSEYPPPGPWEAEMWCWTDFLSGSVTRCRRQGGGTWVKNGMTDPCNGAVGWCDNYGFGPKPGFGR